jgi:hypothetical protein
MLFEETMPIDVDKSGSTLSKKDSESTTTVTSWTEKSMHKENNLRTIPYSLATAMPCQHPPQDQKFSLTNVASPATLSDVGSTAVFLPSDLVGRKVRNAHSRISKAVLIAILDEVRKIADDTED